RAVGAKLSVPTRIGARFKAVCEDPRAGRFGPVRNALSHHDRAAMMFWGRRVSGVSRPVSRRGGWVAGGERQAVRWVVRVRNPGGVGRAGRLGLEFLNRPRLTGPPAPIG